MNKKYLKVLLKLAIKASKKDEAPISALIVYKNKIIAKGYNQRKKTNRTTSHAEIEVIHQANKKRKNWRLNNCTMYITMEPCKMCENVIKEARIDKVYYLVERDLTKKQYDKTIFMKYAENEYPEYIKKYTILLKNFWKNKR